MSVASADNFFADHAKYLVAALVLHVAIGAMLTVTLHATRQNVVPAQLAIKATVVDHSAQRLKREKEKAEAEKVARERAEAEQKQREQAELEAKRLEEKRAEEKRIEDKRIEDKRQEQLAADKKRKLDQNQTAARQKTADDKKRAVEIKTKQAEKQKAEREAREQSQRETELKRQVADEEGRMQAENAGLLSQYAALIQQRVVRNWNRPASARAGIQCEVKVAQTPGGVVLSVQIDSCNGDSAVRQSIEAAVYRSSPLPPPPDARLFQRVIVFVFKPSE